MEEKEEKSAANKRGKDKEREKPASKKHKKKQTVSEKVKGKARARSVSVSSRSSSSSSSSSSSNSSKKTFYFKKEHMPKVLREALRVNNDITFFINCYKILINRHYLILILYSGRLFGNTMRYQKIIGLN
jgi:hypothetical protein